MKKKQKINLLFWLILAIVLDISVIYYWRQMGAPIISLIIGALVYTMFCAVFGLAIYSIINEKYKKYEF